MELKPDLKPGAKLGPYEIVSAIGKGGMGEVWKARDPRLKRDVAIKVAAQQFTDRFEREAHSIAALNHSNICTLYDVGPNYLVMELVEGPTLAERILQGPIPLEEALGMAKQIADALEAAHEKGIIHRDLKPANIKIRPDGSVKVLDFGLAKAANEAVEYGPDSPTMLSVAGMLIGTAGYMAPEQARGKVVDKRADIWAFGVVLYEMVTGQRLFEGDTVSDTLAAVLTREPDWTRVPARVQKLLRRCLEKDPKRRLRDIGDAMALVESDEPATTAPIRSRLGMAGWIAAGVLLLSTVVVSVAYFRGQQPSQILRFTVAFGKGTFVAAGPPAVSPDGRRVAYVVRVEGKSELWVRDLDSLAARPLSTESARYPFWSPDSRTVGFFAGGKLKKIDAAGGPALTLCDAPGGNAGGTWNRNGLILFSTGGSSIFRVSAAGGNPVAVTALNKGSGESSHMFPWFLPDGRHFLYTAFASDEEKNALYIGDLESSERHRLMLTKFNAIYASPGYLLFMREHTLMAQPFDTGKLQTTGDAFPVAEQIDSSEHGSGKFSASQNGVLVYTSGAFGGNVQLTWFDRSGKPAGTVGGPVEMQWPAISPDGKTVAFDRRDAQTGLYDIWLHDLARGTDSRFTSNSRNNEFPVWSPVGNYIAFNSDRNGTFNVYRKSTGGTGQDEVVDKNELTMRPTDWSADGHYLLEEPGNGATHDIWVVPMATEHIGEQAGERAVDKPYPYLRTQFIQSEAKLSPNGQWVAYHSNETKRDEVYVMTFPNPGGKWQISLSGGHNPVWSRDGKELFFISADNKMTAVGIKGTAGKLEAGVPQALFDVRLGFGNASFDVAKDGKFLIGTRVEQNVSVPMTVVVNWAAGLKK